MEDFYQFDNEARDHIATVDEHGRRIWIHPKKPKGRFTTYRTIVAYILVALLLAGPFIKIGGQPLLLLNVFERKFIIFGAAFWPQDLYLFAIGSITFFVAIILFTTVFGRIWCGWACPQTIFMESVFRRIEYWIEGDANQQRKLNAAPWTTGKIIKKVSKQAIFIVISLIISHTVMAYLLGVDRVIELVSHSPMENIGGFTGLMFFSFLFYGVFSYLREQACTVVCPYGRLQGVLLNQNSIVVAYDWVRGEPRGKLKKSEPAESKGDCIDCKLCVHACPTGIDIRNGTQLECVNCTACIDACDDVMTKIGKPRGLIRYASYNSIKEGVEKIITPRTIGYAAVLVVLMTTLGFLLTTRSDFQATVLRVPGQLYQRVDETYIENVYNIQFVNKTFDPIDIELKIRDGVGTIMRVGGEKGVYVEENGLADGIFLVRLPEEVLTGTKTVLTIDMYVAGELVMTEKTSFLGPSK